MKLQRIFHRMIIKNTTIQNKTKQNKLNNQHIIPKKYIQMMKLMIF